MTTRDETPVVLLSATGNCGEGRKCLPCLFGFKKKKMTEKEVLEKYSTPGLRRSQLTREAKKMNMEFDENYRHLTIAERDEILDKLFPETT